MPVNSGFHEVQFPTSISIGSSGGPRRSTEIVTLGSGREQRNQRWADSLRRFDAGYGVKDLNHLHEMIAFYEARRGPLYGFRYRDPLDWKSCLPLANISEGDQVIGTGDGVQTVFQLIKAYGDGDLAYSRHIRKPVSGSVVIAIDTVLQSASSFAVDATQGTVGFLTSPASGSQITAGFAFDVPVRFESDEMTVNLAAFTAGDIPSIPLVEIAL